MEIGETLYPRKPTPRQKALWAAVQDARARSLSFRGVARGLRTQRGTARRYAPAMRPPMYTRVKPATALTDTINDHDDGQFP